MVIDGAIRRDVVNVLNRNRVLSPDVYRQRKGCTREWFLDEKE